MLPSVKMAEAYTRSPHLWFAAMHRMTRLLLLVLPLLPVCGFTSSAHADLIIPVDLPGETSPVQSEAGALDSDDLMLLQSLFCRDDSVGQLHNLDSSDSDGDFGSTAGVRPPVPEVGVVSVEPRETSELVTRVIQERESLPPEPHLVGLFRPPRAR